MTTSTETKGMTVEEIRSELAAQERPLAWLARKVGVSHSHLSRIIIAEERPLTDAMAERIAGVLR